MTEQPPGIRIAVRAVIVREQAVLVQHKMDPNGQERFTLPGGAPHGGETLVEALVRECEEEIGCTVSVADLIHVGDYFKPRSTQPPTTRQQVEILWRCHAPPGYEPRNGPRPDKHQRGVRWLSLSGLRHKCFIPKGLSHVLSQSIPNDPACPEQPVYLGLIE